MLCSRSRADRVMMAGDWRQGSLHGVLPLSADSDCSYVFFRRIGAGNSLPHVTEYPLARGIESRLMIICDNIVALFIRLVLFLRGFEVASGNAACANQNVLSIIDSGSFPLMPG